MDCERFPAFTLHLTLVNTAQSGYTARYNKNKVRTWRDGLSIGVETVRSTGAVCVSMVAVSVESPGSSSARPIS